MKCSSTFNFQAHSLTLRVEKAHLLKQVLKLGKSFFLMSLLIVFFMNFLGLVNPSFGGETNTEKKVSLQEAHLHFAKQANGETWKFLQKSHLTAEEKEVLLYTAFASAYHWKKVGELIHQQRAEWLISRAYTKLEIGPSALLHAQKCLMLTKKAKVQLKDFDLAYAYEGMARAYAVMSDFEKASGYYQKAKQAGENINNKEDRQIFMADFKRGNWNGFQPNNSE